MVRLDKKRNKFISSSTKKSPPFVHERTKEKRTLIFIMKYINKQYIHSISNIITIQSIE